MLQVTKSTASEFTEELSNTKSTDSDHLDQMKPRLSCTEENGAWRRKRTAHDPEHTTSFVKQGGRSVMAWACTGASGTGLLVFIDDVPAGRRSRMNSEVCRAAL